MADTSLFIPELGDGFVDYRDPIWGDSYNWSWNRRTDEIQYLVIHHSVTIHEATPDDIALLHKARGWGGIGYHFVITKDGKVWYVGDVGTARANVLDMNEKVIGICMVGDFTQYLPSDEQIVSCHKLCKFFLEQANWPHLTDWECVVGHKQLQATACPGSSWDKALPDNMWMRIRDGRPYHSELVEEEKPTETGQDTTIKGYKDFVGDLIEKTKVPSDQQGLAEILGYEETLYLKAKGYGRMLDEVARGVGSQEKDETAVLEALRGFTDIKNEEIKEIKKKKLMEFEKGDLLWGFLLKLFRRG